jgi:hypothetical protein
MGKSHLSSSRSLLFMSYIILISKSVENIAKEKEVVWMKAIVFISKAQIVYLIGFKFRVTVKKLCKNEQL